MANQVKKVRCTSTAGSSDDACDPAGMLFGETVEYGKRVIVRAVVADPERPVRISLAEEGVELLFNPWCPVAGAHEDLDLSMVMG